MKQHETTDSVRIDKALVEKIREVSKSKGQTMAGYINLKLQPSVERDWGKLKKKIDGLQQNQS